MNPRIVMLGLISLFLVSGCTSHVLLLQSDISTQNLAGPIKIINNVVIAQRISKDETGSAIGVHDIVAHNFELNQDVWSYRVPNREAPAEPRLDYYGDDDIICFVTNKWTLIALDAHNGKELMTFPNVNQYPAYEKGILYFSTQEGKIYAMDLKTGKEQWTMALDKTKEMIYANIDMTLSEKNLLIGLDGQLWAVDTMNGHVVWKVDKSYAKKETGAGTEVVVYRNYVMYDPGSVYAFDIATGQQIWENKDNDISAYYGITSDGIGHIYLGYWQGENLVRMDVETGNRSNIPLPARNFFTYKIHENGNIYLNSSDGYVYAINANTGGELWKIKSNIPLGLSDMYLSKKYLTYVNSDGADRPVTEAEKAGTCMIPEGCGDTVPIVRPHLIVVDALTGQQLDSFKLNNMDADQADYKFLDSDGYMYFFTFNHLYKFLLQ